jgi:Zn-dependent protease
MFNSLDVQKMILTVPAILIAFTFHEYAHALVADKLGDKTPKFQGRLTLNPFVHIDLVGFLLILVAGFGWAKPVETNPRSFKNYYKDDLKVSLAGPFANLIVALIFSILLGVYIKIANGVLAGVSISLLKIILNIIVYTIRINTMLFFFNLLPLPGLDGFHAFRDLFPSKFYKVAEQLYKYQMIILLIFVATPAAGYIIGVPTDLVLQLFTKIAYIVAG